MFQAAAVPIISIHCLVVLKQAAADFMCAIVFGLIVDTSAYAADIPYKGAIN
jgi:hypothetical protein